MLSNMLQNSCATCCATCPATCSATCFASSYTTCYATCCATCFATWCTTCCKHVQQHATQLTQQMLSNCKGKSYKGNNFWVNDGRRRRRRRRVILVSRAAPPLCGQQPKIMVSKLTLPINLGLKNREFGGISVYRFLCFSLFQFPSSLYNWINHWSCVLWTNWFCTG